MMSLNKILNKFSFLKSTLLYQLSQEIVYSSIIKFLSNLYSKKVNEKLIILSAYGGKAFVDNSKYIFNYLVKNTDYKVVWITNSYDLLNKLKTQGFHTIYKFDFKTIKLLRKAKYIFTTHGIYDVLPIDFSPNTCFICTWHGVQNKRNSAEHGPIRFQKLAKILRLTTLNDNYMDYFLTTSGTKKDKELIVNYFQIPSKKILALGYPRNDILFTTNQTTKPKIRDKYNIKSNVKRILLYAPTFRDKSLTAKFPLTLKELNKLNDLLFATNSILLMKAHMFENKINFQTLSNIQSAPKDSDIQELLAITDILITDYSSVYCDFLLVDRPILFFTYDYHAFMNTGRGFYYDFEKIVPGPLLYTGQELINAIKNIDAIKREFEAKRKETRKIFHKYIDGNSTERLLKFLKIID